LQKELRINLDNRILTLKTYKTMAKPRKKDKKKPPTKPKTTRRKRKY
tara:strand:+ start:314 stop:454 length:141 start_codon:yes stop_codon:yes gene_type:complete